MDKSSPALIETLRVLDSETFVLESAKIINLRDSSDAKWLRNHQIWCASNDRKVSITRPR